MPHGTKDFSYLEIPGASKTFPSPFGFQEAGQYWNQVSAEVLQSYDAEKDARDRFEQARELLRLPLARGTISAFVFDPTNWSGVKAPITNNGFWDSDPAYEVFELEDESERWLKPNFIEGMGYVLLQVVDLGKLAQPRLTIEHKHTNAGPGPDSNAFIALSAALEGHFGGAFADLTDGLRKRVEEAFTLIPWDKLTASQKRAVAIQWDFQNDPACQSGQQRMWELNVQIGEWEVVPAPTATDKATKERRLAELKQELERLDSEAQRLAFARWGIGSPVTCSESAEWGQTQLKDGEISAGDEAGSACDVKQVKRGSGRPRSWCEEIEAEAERRFRVGQLGKGTSLTDAAKSLMEWHVANCENHPGLLKRHIHPLKLGTVENAIRARYNNSSA